MGRVSLAAAPDGLIEKPRRPQAGRPLNDVLSDVLRTIRLSGSLQFCFMPTGDWQTEGKRGLASLAEDPSVAIPFHILVEGTCWLRMDGHETVLEAGDAVAFPFASSHRLGVGALGTPIAPVDDLPPKPWREVPILRYGEGGAGVRLLCGYLHCDALRFPPLRDALPPLMHVRTARSENAAWLRATIGQMAAEVARARPGALSMLERMTEIVFIELLRHQALTAGVAAKGWLAALADPALGRCLALIHDEPQRDWSVQELAAASALSRTVLTERFEAMLETSPIRYLRDWRLCLASVALTTTSKTVANIAYDAGYGTEAAFSRAFSRSYGMPPATWRQAARSSAHRSSSLGP
jgi:AraC-like DNA-binding protein